MKNFILVFFVVLFSSFTMLEDQNERQVVLSGKWYIESVQEQGEKPEKVENKEDEWIHFHKDGKVEEGQFGEVTSGTWTYLKEKKAFKVSFDDTVFYKIIELSDNKMTLEVGEGLGSDDYIMVNYTK